MKDKLRTFLLTLFGVARIATYYKGGFMAMGSAWYEDTPKRAEEAERGQAGKE